jgi:hypothetical protein
MGGKRPSCLLRSRSVLSGLLPTCLAKVNDCIGSKADLQRLQEHCRISTRKQTFGAEDLQSARRRNLRRGFSLEGARPKKTKFTGEVQITNCGRRAGDPGGCLRSPPSYRSSRSPMSMCPVRSELLGQLGMLPPQPLDAPESVHARALGAASVFQVVSFPGSPTTRRRCNPPISEQTANPYLERRGREISWWRRLP